MADHLEVGMKRLQTELSLRRRGIRRRHPGRGTGAFSVGPETPILPGAPVLIKEHGKWVEATVLQTFDADKVIVLRDVRAGTTLTDDLKLGDLRIHPRVVAALNVPENEEKFASRAERVKRET